MITNSRRSSECWPIFTHGLTLEVSPFITASSIGLICQHDIYTACKKQWFPVPRQCILGGISGVEILEKKQGIHTLQVSANHIRFVLEVILDKSVEIERGPRYFVPWMYRDEPPDLFEIEAKVFRKIDLPHAAEMAGFSCRGGKHVYKVRILSAEPICAST